MFFIKHHAADAYCRSGVRAPCTLDLSNIVKISDQLRVSGKDPTGNVGLQAVWAT
jgi:hypothetical protein